MKKALVIGIDHYKSLPLSGCVNDAQNFAELIEKNEDNSPNFSVKLLTSSDSNIISTNMLNEEIEKLFDNDADTVLLYFAGHGLINNATNAGYIVSQDFSKGSWGMSLADILTLANKAYPKIKSAVIILDTCHSGSLGETPSLLNMNLATVGTGVTILTACHRNEIANEISGHGIFTSIVLDGLKGGCADICGRITPASLYSHVDQVLGPWDQRPMYKANVQMFITLRQVKPKIPLEILRNLVKYFPNAEHIFPLDPSFEPDRENIPEELRHLPTNSKNIAIFKELQMYNRHGLVVPIDAEHMYYAAIESKACKLTALGAHYRKLAEIKRI